MNNLRFAVRQLVKSPGFTGIALLTLALGIGVNTSMFSVLNTLLFHAAPYPRTAELMRVHRVGPTFQTAPHSPANFIDLHAQVQSFAGLAAYSGNDYSLAEAGRPAERLRGLDVSGDFFAVLGVAPAFGRFITPEDDQPGHGSVIVLSHATWQQQFGGDPKIVDRLIHLGGENVTVIGVMPPGFDDPLIWGQVQAWRPLAFDAKTRNVRVSNWLRLMGRLKPGATAEQATAELSAIAANLARQYPEANAKVDYSVVPFVRSTQDATTRLLSWFAMGLALCVLLIACANLANLLFARNARRAHEFALRAALGASRTQIVRLALTESILLGLVGGALGLLVAVWGNDALGSRLLIAGQAGFKLPVDWRVAGFAAAAALVVGLGFGLLPALLAARTDVNENLKQGARGSTASTNHRLRQTLIIAEFALTLVLLSGAGFFIRGMERFLARDHGWETDHLLTASLTLPATNYPDDASQVRFHERLLSRLEVLPGVAQVALSRTLPFSEFGWGQRFVVEGQTVPARGAEPMRDVNGVSTHYFDTVGLRLVAGRSFTAEDMNGPVRTIINEAMARQLWPGESAIGRHIKHPNEKDWQEIIGVVRNVTFATNLNKESSPFQTYRLFSREPGRGIVISLRSSLPPATLGLAVQRVVAEIEPELPVQDLRTATETIDLRLSNYATTGRLLGGFALLGLLLAAIGIYGVLSGFVTQRRSEIGIRMALGAQVRDVLALVLGQGLRLTLIGTALGLLGSVAVAKLLGSMLPALPRAEPITALLVSVMLLTVAAFACYLPAWRATKLSPLDALRAE
ncbi:MAG: ABC transporter permease [Opitutus sp.]